MNYKKSTVNAFTNASQVATPGSLLRFDDGQVTGCSMDFVPGSTTVVIEKPGLYLVEFHGTTVAATQTQLLRNNVPVPGTLQGGTTHTSFATVIEVPPSCCAVDNSTRLAVQNVGSAATYQNASLTIVKLA